MTDNNTTINNQVNTAELMKEMRLLVADMTKDENTAEQVVKALEDKLSLVTGALVENELGERVAEELENLLEVNKKQLNTIAQQADELTELALKEKKLTLQNAGYKQIETFIEEVQATNKELLTAVREQKAEVSRLEEQLNDGSNSYKRLENKYQRLHQNVDQKVSEAEQAIEHEYSLKIKQQSLRIQGLMKQLAVIEDENNTLRDKCGLYTQFTSRFRAWAK